MNKCFFYFFYFKNNKYLFNKLVIKNFNLTKYKYKYKYKVE